MEDFEIIDAHVHLSRTIEEEAENWPRPGRRECELYGTPEGALSYMDMAGISKMAVMNLVPRQFRASLADRAKLSGLPEDRRRAEEERIAQQVGPLVREFNEWGCETGRRFPRFIPFICVSRELGDARAIVDEVVLRAKQGARGVKLHPAMFRLFPYDRELWPMYARCQELGLPLLADSAPLTRLRVLAMYPYSFDLNDYRPPVEYGEPENFAPVLEEFPRLTLILAHLGAPWWDERIDLARAIRMCTSTPPRASQRRTNCQSTRTAVSLKRTRSA
ncbi:MAG: amidohydrolase family protein [Chloroflexi bacterium]|nr:amidohydrolase family protein [Chloroflexota bacterium]